MKNKKSIKKGQRGFFLATLGVALSVILIFIVFTALYVEYLFEDNIQQSDSEYGSFIRQYTFGISLLALASSTVASLVLGRFYARHAMRPLQMALDSQKSFIGCASHELNNPLTAIQGECEITLMKPRTADEYVESLQRISTESKRLSELTKQLLFLSRLDRDMLQEESERFDLHNLLAELCQDNSRIVYKGDEGLQVEASYHLLGVALKNIIDNALKYSKATVEVTLTAVNGSPRIEVLDHGIGIPAEETKSITQSFFRANNAMGFEGHGIGLSLTHKILQLYGYKMEVLSEEGRYTKVTVSKRK